MPLEGFAGVKKSSDSIGIQTYDLLGCIVLQPPVLLQTSLGLCMYSMDAVGTEPLWLQNDWMMEKCLMKFSV
jgi:hypothetical protein